MHSQKKKKHRLKDSLEEAAEWLAGVSKHI